MMTSRLASVTFSVFAAWHILLEGIDCMPAPVMRMMMLDAEWIMPVCCEAPPSIGAGVSPVRLRPPSGSSAIWTFLEGRLGPPAAWTSAPASASAPAPAAASPPASAPAPASSSPKAKTPPALPPASAPASAEPPAAGAPPAPAPSSPSSSTSTVAYSLRSSSNEMSLSFARLMRDCADPWILLSFCRLPALANSLTESHWLTPNSITA
mmetsp:Transcript_97633/g.315229  ORF Transcript_97633/g.315229 Transcript_97633/m.315229 type:complete len:209 (-) Transcript_97633:901-1527(-)